MPDIPALLQIDDLHVHYADGVDALRGVSLTVSPAERIGLIWRCVDDASLAETTMALAQRLAAMPSRALAETRRSVDDAMAMSNPTRSTWRTIGATALRTNRRHDSSAPGWSRSPAKKR